MLTKSEEYSEPSKKSEMEIFANTATERTLTISEKTSIFDSIEKFLYLHDFQDYKYQLKYCILFQFICTI